MQVVESHYGDHNNPPNYAMAEPAAHLRVEKAKNAKERHGHWEHGRGSGRCTSKWRTWNVSVETLTANPGSQAKPQRNKTSVNAVVTSAKKLTQQGRMQVHSISNSGEPRTFRSPSPARDRTCHAPPCRRWCAGRASEKAVPQPWIRLNATDAVNDSLRSNYLRLLSDRTVLADQLPHPDDG